MHTLIETSKRFDLTEFENNRIMQNDFSQTQEAVYTVHKLRADDFEKRASPGSAHDHDASANSEKQAHPDQTRACPHNG